MGHATCGAGGLLRLAESSRGAGSRGGSRPAVRR